MGAAVVRFPPAEQIPPERLEAAYQLIFRILMKQLLAEAAPDMETASAVKAKEAA